MAVPVWPVPATANNAQSEGAVPATRVLQYQRMVVSVSVVCAAVQHAIIMISPLAQVAEIIQVQKWSAGHASHALIPIVSLAQVVAVMCVSQVIMLAIHNFACQIVACLVEPVWMVSRIPVLPASRVPQSLMGSVFQTHPATVMETVLTVEWQLITIQLIALVCLVLHLPVVFNVML